MEATISWDGEICFSLTRTYKDIYLGNSDCRETLLRSGGNISVKRNVLSNILISEENKSCLGFEIELSLRILDIHPQCIFIYNRNAIAYHLEHPKGVSRPWNFKSAYEYGKARVNEVFRFKNYLNPKGACLIILLEELFRTIYSLKKVHSASAYQVIGERLGSIMNLSYSLVKNVINCKNNEASSRFRTVTLTFDDSYLSVYERALPVVEAYGLRGVVFSISDLIGGTFEKQRLLNANQIRELISKG